MIKSLMRKLKLSRPPKVCDRAKEIQYNIDPNGIRPDDDPLLKNKHVFVFKHGILRCEELNLECIAEGHQLITITLPGGLSFSNAADDDNFTSAHWFPSDMVKELKKLGVFDKPKWIPND